MRAAGLGEVSGRLILDRDLAGDGWVRPGDVKVRAMIERVESVDDELVQTLARLVPQLSRTSPPPTPHELEEIVATQTILVARDAARIVGALTLVLYRIPTGLRARIEDVVVDASSRGHGVGEALAREAIDRARSAGARHVELTSNPSRETANRLYRRLGFERRETNVYRLDL
jgi:ribosomal protein S18 acetylase RimI-like enzyme